jgi:hypothetical protein
MRFLKEDPSAVARVGLGAAGTSVVKVFEHAEALLDHSVALVAVQIHEDTDTTVGSLSAGASGRTGLGWHEGWGWGGVTHNRVVHLVRMCTAGSAAAALSGNFK